MGEEAEIQRADALDEQMEQNDKKNEKDAESA
jgi:hypothetical protein